MHRFALLLVSIVFGSGALLAPGGAARGSTDRCAIVAPADARR